MAQKNKYKRRNADTRITKNDVIKKSSNKRKDKERYHRTIRKTQVWKGSEWNIKSCCIYIKLKEISDRTLEIHKDAIRFQRRRCHCQ